MKGIFFMKWLSFVQCWKGEDIEDTQNRRSLHTWEWAWSPVRSCTTSVQQWGQPDRPLNGSFHLCPPGNLVPASLQKLWKEKIKVTKKVIKSRRIPFEINNEIDFPTVEFCFNVNTDLFTFTFLLLFWDLLHPPKQTPQICDAIHKGNLFILVWPGLLQDLPHIHLWSVILLFWLPSGAVYEGTMWGQESQAGVCNVSWGATH